MTKKRQGEIALLLVEHTMRKKGLSLTQESRDDSALLAEQIGVPQRELARFTATTSSRLVKEWAAKKPTAKTPKDV